MSNEGLGNFMHEGIEGSIREEDFLREQEKEQEQLNEEQEKIKEQIEKSLSLEFLDNKFIIASFHSIHVTVHTLISKIIYRKYLEEKKRINVESFFELSEVELKMLEPVVCYFVKKYISKYFPFISFVMTYGSIVIEQHIRLKSYLKKSCKKNVDDGIESKNNSDDKINS